MALDEARFRLSERPRAIDVLERAKKRNPHNPLLWESLATLYTLKGGRQNWTLATEYYLKSEEIAPYRYERLLKWADAHYRLRQWQFAQNRLSAYLAAVPNDPEALALQAEILKHRPSLAKPEDDESGSKPARKLPWE